MADVQTRFLRILPQVKQTPLSDFAYCEDDKKVILKISGTAESDYSLLLETSIKKLKRNLEGWREVILPINKVLLWEKHWYPSAIIGAVTTLFLVLWLLDPSLLTVVAVLALLITVCDYAVPSLSTSLLRTGEWTGAKEKEFDQICRTTVIYYNLVIGNLYSFYVMRTTRPRVFYGISLFSFTFLAWLGSSINNLLLTYLLVCLLLMLPGLEHHGVLHKYGHTLTQKISDYAKSKVASNKTD